MRRRPYTPGTFGAVLESFVMPARSWLIIGINERCETNMVQFAVVLHTVCHGYGFNESMGIVDDNRWSNRTVGLFHTFIEGDDR